MLSGHEPLFVVFGMVWFIFIAAWVAQILGRMDDG